MNTTDHANVAIKPPILFLGALALGCLLSLVIPIGPRLASPNGLALTVGLTFVGLGFALAALSARKFQLAGTQVMPDRPSTALVTTGPYHFTRNPIYIGFVLIYFGLSIILTSAWVLLLLVPTLIVLQRGVVAREEAYLERTFGDAYRRYQARVPRWL
jgi:protein-S-isoprenylcysteine O-methyltransferase Ste14